MQVKDKIFFVSGANRGIGAALVEELLRRGVKKVYAAARNTEQLPDFGDDRVVKMKLDITDQSQVATVAKDADDTEVLINNAGVAEFVSALDGSMDKIQYEMDVNYYGTLSMMRAFVPVLEGKAGAAMVNVASIVSFVSFPFLSSYCASKAALFSITQGSRIELASRGIAVHSVNPGPIDTDMGKDLEMDKTSPEETANGILNGLEAGEADIFPDPIGKEMFDVWCADYRSLEQMVVDQMEAA